MAVLGRQHLETIGLKAERPELFVTTNERHQMRVHDLRGTFVTLSLAAGRSEPWIADRTGHRSSPMINRYKRTARSFAELEPWLPRSPRGGHCRAGSVGSAGLGAVSRGHPAK